MDGNVQAYNHVTNSDQRRVNGNVHPPCREAS